MIDIDKKEVVKHYREILDREFPREVDRVILFDRVVLGKSAKRSDIDLLVILKNDYGWEREDKILALGYELDLKFDIVSDIKVVSQNELETVKGNQVYIQEALENGLEG